MTAWQKIGMWFGGTVTAIAVSPEFESDGLVLAATRAGIFRSVDGGNRWTAAVHGFADPGAVSIAFAPRNPHLLWASSDQGRLYHSEDGGLTWMELTSWSGLGLVTSLHFSPNYDEDGTLFVATEEGVFRTLNRGNEWQEATFGLLDPEVLCLVCAPDYGNTQVLWAGTALGGLFRSRNGGLAWRESGTGLPDCAIQSIVLSPEFITDGTLYVGTENDGVYISNDGGVNWTRAGSQLAGMSVNCLSVLPAKHAPSSLLFAGTEAGIYVSLDAGASWRASASADFLALALATGGEKTIFAASYREGLFSSSECGLRWKPLGATSIAAHVPPLVKKSPANFLYMLDVDGALVLSADGGRNWQTEPFDDSPGPIVAMVAGTSPAEELIFLATDDGKLMRGRQPVKDLTCIEHPANGIGEVALHVGDENGCHLLLTDGNGRLHLGNLAREEWQRLESPWTDAATVYLAFSLWYDKDRTLYAVTRDGNQKGNFDFQLWQLSGQSEWQNLASLESEIPAVLVHQLNDATGRSLILATQHRIIRFYRSGASKKKHDGALSVSQHFFDPGTQVTALTSGPATAGTDAVYAATSRGLYISTDHGQEWAFFSALPAERPVVALEMVGNEEGEQLIAVTLGGEVWRAVERDSGL